ncbi:hypothetical protein BS17DRAFT_689063, partial [Gyrodon lividus]
AHQFHPLHQMEQWSGDHFTPSSVRAAGLMLYLGHGGEKCPLVLPMALNTLALHEAVE